MSRPAPGAARRGTYSIIARDADSGELGVAVQSHWFSVGSLVPWALPGVGAVATQANVEVSYGPRALALMQAGAGAQAALEELLAADPAADTRQVAVLDSHGDTAVHTGSGCVPFAGHVAGRGYCCQGNIMASERVWPAMARAFESARGSLAARLLVSLEAADAAGGDIRGRQSAALLVVPASGAPWEEVISLRVEDDPEPLVALRRLIGLHGAYELAGRADELVGAGRLDRAAELYREASELAPESHELLFWAGLGAAHSGDLERGLSHVREAIARQPGWADLLARLTDEMAPGVQTVRDHLQRE